MRPIRCRLHIESDSRHLQQLYTGLIMLERDGKISLEILFSRQHSNSAACLLEANEKRLVFDTNDTRNINPESLANCDAYFKRSFCQATVDATRFANKVHPYGLNYRVLPDFPNRLFFAHEWTCRGIKGALKYAVKQADRALKFHFEPRVSIMQWEPDTRDNLRVLYSTRLWDPDSDPYFALGEEEREDRKRINIQRAECVSRLRNELGPLYTGGLEHSDYAKRTHPDLLVSDPRMTKQQNYLGLVRTHPLCIASAGLHQSTGWRFAEYVALSRSILSEPLAFSTPDGFSAGTNYQEFRSTDECIEKVIYLMDHPDVMHSMMQANRKYYSEFLRPDKLVYARLEEAVAGNSYSERDQT